MNEKLYSEKVELVDLSVTQKNTGFKYNNIGPFPPMLSSGGVFVIHHFSRRTSILGLTKEKPAKAVWSIESIKPFSQ